MATSLALRRHRRMRHLLAAFTTAFALILGSFVAASPPAEATPPGIPSASTARSQLNSLTVRSELSMSGYSRSQFPHWIGISGNCNAREMVLRRDGTNVSVNNSCYPTSGSWYSVYDGVTVSSPSSVDIDHVIPLAEAWRSGARNWTTSQRRSFANDLSGPQLIAVTASSNRSKGDRDPASWKPPRASYHCTYARMWVGAKHRWNLSLQSSERSALNSMLNTC